MICAAALLCLGLIFLAAFLTGGKAKLVVYNGSDSMPRGFYRLTGEAPAVGRIICFPLLARVHDYVRTRMGKEIGDWRIIKTIVAAEGDHVCVTDDGFSLNGQHLAGVPLTDSLGKPMPVWHECRQLVAGEFFVFSDRIERSLDSRYLGPIRAEDVIGVYVPLWTWRSARNGDGP